MKPTKADLGSVLMRGLGGHNDANGPPLPAFSGYANTRADAKRALAGLPPTKPSAPTTPEPKPAAESKGNRILARAKELMGLDAALDLRDAVSMAKELEV